MSPLYGPYPSNNVLMIPVPFVSVSKAEVLYHTDENGKKLEPMETAVIDVPEEFSGVVIEKLSQRKGELRITVSYLYHFRLIQAWQYRI